MHKAAWYAGLRPASYLATAGSRLTVNVQTVSAAGARFPSAALAIKFYRRVWEQTTEKDETGLDRPTWKPTDTLVASDSVTTDAQGRAQTNFTPREAGEYRVVAEGRDAQGNPVAIGDVRLRQRRHGRRRADPLAAAEQQRRHPRGRQGKLRARRHGAYPGHVALQPGHRPADGRARPDPQPSPGGPARAVADHRPAHRRELPAERLPEPEHGRAAERQGRGARLPAGLSGAAGVGGGQGLAGQPDLQRARSRTGRDGDLHRSGGRRPWRARRR